MRFQVPVQHLVLVAFGCTVEELVQKGLNLVLGQVAGRVVEELLEVLVEEFEDEGQLFVGVEDVHQSHDIRVLQLLKESNLPDSRTRNPLVIRF